jgi:subtilase family serine protease
VRVPLSPAAGRAAGTLAAVAALALSGLTAAAPANAHPAAPAGHPHLTTAAQGIAGTSATRTSATRACALPTRPGVMACNALKVAGRAAPRGVETLPPGYGPSDIQKLYGLPSTTAGAGRTVAVVAAYDDPTAESDLAGYRSTYGLPACTAANGCFTKVNQSGAASPLPAADAGWAEEISLDLDMVSATCPNCHILLVEASSATMTNLGTAVNRAVAMGAKYVSNSYGGGESSADTSYDSSYFNHPGVAITASAGDSGFGVEYPAASRYVTAVGATTLTSSPTPGVWPEAAASAGGCSVYDAKPTWQHDTFCTRRTLVDVAALGGGMAVYDTYGGDPGWEVLGGTSASAPIIASVYALAGVPSAGSYPASFPYAHPTALHDITRGTGAGPGYDPASGLGTPNGVTAFAG